MFFGALQALLVSLFSMFFAIFFETMTIENILNEYVSIIYAGVLSGGIAFTLQIYAQKNISAAPAAIIFSLEGVFATIAAWYLLNQILDINNLFGCLFILLGVLFSYFTVKFFLVYINKFSLNIFVLYRLIIGIFLLFTIYN